MGCAARAVFQTRVSPETPLMKEGRNSYLYHQELPKELPKDQIPHSP